MVNGIKQKIININNLLKEVFLYCIHKQFSFSFFHFILHTRIYKRIKFYPRKIAINDFKIFLEYSSIFTIYEGLKEYEKHKEFIPTSDWTVLDIGAFTGLFSLKASKLVGKKGRVIAFEPNPISFYWLNKNIELNKAKNIRSYPFALGNNNGYANFALINVNEDYGKSALSEIAKLRKTLNVLIKEICTIKVPMFKLDTLYDKGLINDYINLMKIDVEGGELLVLKGSKKLLNKSLIDKLIIEIHLDVVKDKEIINFLKEFKIKLEKKINVPAERVIGYFKSIK